MKIKSLLVAGAVLATGAVSALAQGTVYSVNAVGFVNLVYPSGFSLSSNPLNAATNDAATLFPTPPAGSKIYKFDANLGAFTSSSFILGAWRPAVTIVPGEGFFFLNATGTPFTNTFVGNVQQGTLNTSLNAGFSLVSSQVPQAGLLQTDLGFVPAAGDSVYTFDNNLGAYNSSTFLLGAWRGAGEPQIAVGQGFFVKKVASATWTRTFSVNQ